MRLAANGIGGRPAKVEWAAGACDRITRWAVAVIADGCASG
jgi:hypothetical protein